ncbi:MAG: HAMP domain-containing protein [Vallitaleaceae bacterium]|nr:HAMP domain-containing protein [Vallitaleaceae bacterium]
MASTKRKITLISKYQICLFFCIILFIGIIFTVNQQMNKVKSKMEILNIEDAKVEEVTDLQMKFLEIESLVSGYISFIKSDSLETYKTKNQVIINDIDAVINKIDDEEVIEKLIAVKEATQELERIFFDSIVYAVDRNLKSQYILSQEDYIRINQKNILSLEDTIDTFNNNKKIAQTEANVILKNTQLFVIFLITLSILVTVISVYLLTSNVSKRLKKLVIVNQSIANKQLNMNGFQDKSSDEIGMLSSTMNTMLDNLKMIIKEIFQASDSLKGQGDIVQNSCNLAQAESNEIQEAMNELSIAVNSQSEFMNTIVEDIEILTTQIMDTNGQSRELSKASEQLHRLSNEGNEVMATTIEGMGKIESIVTKSVDMVHSLEDQSKSISSLIDVINNISTQTNLLSLNASIEAARAGDAGKGFKVVASEIGNLSKQVSESVLTISSIIKNLQVETKEVCTALEDSYTEVTEGAKNIKLTGEKFSQINQEANLIENRAISIDKNLDVVEDRSNNVRDSLEQISAISQETSASIEQTLSAVAQQNNSLSTILNNSKDLNLLSNELSDMISEFIL